MIIVVDGVFAALLAEAGTDYLSPRMKRRHYFVSAVSIGLGMPAMMVALSFERTRHGAGNLRGGFLLLLNTRP